jgi:hypothetical protein
MKRMKRVTIVVAAVVAAAGSAIAFSDEGSRRFAEFLNGLKEAPAIVSTTATGTFRAFINHDETEIRYVLTFKDLEGDVRQAHIHIGHPQNAGGIVLWLCDSDANPAPSDTTPACNVDNPLDNRNGRVTGTLTAADVRDLPANGIAGAPVTTPGEFAEVVALIRAGATYVNVHSAKFGAGEIRSQIANRNDNDHDHRKH